MQGRNTRSQTYSTYTQGLPVHFGLHKKQNNLNRDKGFDKMYAVKELRTFFDHFKTCFGIKMDRFQHLNRSEMLKLDMQCSNCLATCPVSGYCVLVLWEDNHVLLPLINIAIIFADFCKLFPAAFNPHAPLMPLVINDKIESFMLQVIA